jgi:hypothetical protein
MEEDEDRRDMMSVYSRLVIGNAMNKRDDETSSMKTVNTATLSRYSVMMRNNNISVPNIRPIDINKKGKSAMRVFNRNSYYMVINNETDYYVDDEFKIYANGFNDNVYCFPVRKGSDIIEYTLQKPDANKRSPRYDVVYKMNGSVFTIVETVQELGGTLRDCFEDNIYNVYELKGEDILPSVNKTAPKLEYQLEINAEGDVEFVVEEFNKRKNVYYKMHLLQAMEQIYIQTASDEMKRQVNGVNNVYKAVPYGYDGKLCNYIVKMIRIPNTENKYTYRFMDIIRIIVQYGITVGDELDSRADDMVDLEIDDEGRKKRQHNSDSDSYASLKNTTDFYSKNDDI